MEIYLHSVHSGCVSDLVGSNWKKNWHSSIHLLHKWNKAQQNLWAFLSSIRMMIYTHTDTSRQKSILQSPLFSCCNFMRVSRVFWKTHNTSTLSSVLLENDDMYSDDVALLKQFEVNQANPWAIISAVSFVSNVLYLNLSCSCKMARQ